MDVELGILLKGIDDDTVANRSVNGDKIKIEIFLEHLKTRKNIAMKRLAKNLNAYYLLECICGIWCMDGDWNESDFCGNGNGDCKGRRALKDMNVFIDNYY